jgi:hypothetical protein
MPTGSDAEAARQQEVKAMSHKIAMTHEGRVARRARVPASLRRLVKFVFLGGAAGLIVGIGALFVVAVLYGEAIGLSPGACALFACSATMLLSQPAGIAGMLSGAIVGLAAGAVVYYVHHHVPRPG